MEEAEGGAEAARLAAAGQSEEDRALDLSLRPRVLGEFVGQERTRKILGMSIEAARQRGEVLDHVLFSGPPGLGKTSLAHIIARERGVSMRSTSGPAIERAGDLAAIVSGLDEGDVLFIDEIHRLARPVEEVLYPAMEDFELNIVVGKGMGARTMPLAVKPFTLVGATTRSGLLSAPLRDRFGQHFHLDFYDRDELTEIVARSARLLGIRVDDHGAHEIAGRARGTPRVANRLLRRVRDFAQVNEAATVTREVAIGALELLEIDACGFDRMDRAILAAIIDKFDGGPVGVESLAAAVGEEADTIGEVYEPYLLQEGFIARTARGRMATARAYSHLGRTRRGTLL
jgi:holliday junction DNA helicase RuvB